MRTAPRPSHSQSRRRSRRGFSLPELLVALAITAGLLTAVVMSIDASFRAYAAAAESASTNTATRLAVHKILGMVRGGRSHGPLSTLDDPTVVFSGDVATHDRIEFVDPNGYSHLIYFDDATDRILAQTTTPLGSAQPAQEVLAGVETCVFQIQRTKTSTGAWVLARASVDISVRPDPDQSLAIEADDSPPIRYTGSTAPRQLR
ncbi:MAG: prepilin-type N-terminal cleavage/methylation domain-containing protein [Planctomycetota bacterium]